jgi:hypothetical protein
MDDRIAHVPFFPFKCAGGLPAASRAIVVYSNKITKAQITLCNTIFQRFQGYERVFTGLFRAYLPSMIMAVT